MERITLFKREKKKKTSRTLCFVLKRKVKCYSQKEETRRGRQGVAFTF